MKKIKQSGFSGVHQTTPTKAQPVKRTDSRPDRRVSHEQAAIEIKAAGLRHAASPETARAFLRRIGVLDSNNELSPHYR